MKKHLFGTTALVTAGMLASSMAYAEGGIKLGIGGYMNNYFGVGDVSDDGVDVNQTGLFSDGEVQFSGETTLDNGLTFGANVQLESFASGDQIDENYGYVKGGFGRLQFGSENTAAYLMQYSAPNVGVPVNSGWVTVFVPAPAGFGGAFRSPAVSTYLDTGNDDNTLTYFTPRMFGFQVGVSYQAAVVFSGEGKNFPVEAVEDTEYKDGVAVGVNFVESFGGVDVAIAGGYRRASAPDDDITILIPGTPGNNNAQGVTRTIRVPDMEQFSAGFNLGYGGVTVGGSYAAETSGRKTAVSSAFGTGSGVAGPIIAAHTAGFSSGGILAFAPGTFTSDVNSTEGQSWDAGVSYTTGPWSFGAIYFYGETEGSVRNGDEDVLQAVEAGVEYAVGPGIRTNLSALYANYDGENGADNQGYAGIVGISFGF